MSLSENISQDNSKDYTSLVVKYKPTDISEIVGQQNFSKKIASWIMGGNVPHLLFVGPPGVGKTSAAYVLVREIFDNDNFTTDLKEYNESNNREIEFIGSKTTHEIKVGPMCTKNKIIFVDEVDYMTPDLQVALRKKIETLSENATFIITCNNSEKVIQPIKDFFKLIYFNRIKEKDIVDRLKYICEKENIHYDPGALDKIAKISNGSLRTAIRNIEVYKVDGYIDEDDIDLDTPSSDIIKVESLLKKVFEGKLTECDIMLLELYNSGWFSARHILTSSFEIILNDKSINEAVKRDLLEQIGIYEWRINKGADELLQLRCFLSSLGRYQKNSHNAK